MNIEAFTMPVFFMDTDRSDVFFNSAAVRWLEELGVEQIAPEITACFRSLEGEETLPIIAREVHASFQSRVCRFRLVTGTVEERIDFFLQPYHAGTQAGVIVHLLSVDMLDRSSEEIHKNLNLLVRARTAEISDLNTFLTAIVDSSTETFIIAVGSNNSILSFNEGACQIFNYTRGEAIGTLVAPRLFAGEERTRGTWDQMMLQAQEEGKSHRLTYLVRKDGSVFPALVDLTLLRNSEQQSLGYLFLGRDFTEDMKIQQDLEERKEELEFLNMLSLDINQTLRLEDISIIALQHLMKKFQAVAGAVYLRTEADTELRQIVLEPPNCTEAMQRQLSPTSEEQMLAEEEEVQFHEMKVYYRDALGFASSQRMRKLILPLSPKAELRGLVILLTDQDIGGSAEFRNFLSAAAVAIGAAMENAILYHDSLNKSLEIKKQNQELDEFAYVVSHDLKEPLAGISFISNLIVDDYYDKFDETGKTYISSLIDFSKRLGSLIDALLDLSRIGRITNQPEKVLISEVLHDVQQNLSFRIASRDIKLHLPVRAPAVWGDKTRIEQVFFNLLSNAIKFNNKDSVRVDIGYVEQDEDFYQFHVVDNGIGIEPQYFDKIFKIFERLNPREEYEGNGAGLTIVKKIIENHNGKIWLDSTVGKGTTFYFTLPRYKTPQESRATP